MAGNVIEQGRSGVQEQRMRSSTVLCDMVRDNSILGLRGGSTLSFQVGRIDTAGWRNHLLVNARFQKCAVSQLANESFCVS
jgi:hypothetical protein